MVVFNTTNESKEYNKPRIPAGEYGFEISNVKTNENQKVFFILNIEGQINDKNEQVSLVWAAPLNEEYSPKTNVGKILLSVGIELGTEINSDMLIGLKGKCIVTDYVKQENGKTLIYSVVNDLVIPEKSE